MRRRAIRGFSAVLVVVMTAFSCQISSAQEHKAINLSSAKDLPFSDGIIAGSTLYVAGQEGTDEAGKLVSGGIGPETKAAISQFQQQNGLKQSAQLDSETMSGLQSGGSSRSGAGSSMPGNSGASSSFGGGSSSVTRPNNSAGSSTSGGMGQPAH